MASLRGAATVRFGADTSDFDRGIAAVTGRMRDVESTFLRSVDPISRVKAGLAALAGAATIGTFGKLISDGIKSAAALKGLHEQTGLSIETLSAMQPVADGAGVSLDEIAAISNKLTRGLAGVDDETKGAGKALAALGLDLEKFKQLSPDEQFQEIAKALDQFADDGDKANIAMALFGKTGAAALPFLKDLAEAGELNATVTREQAIAADEYEKSQARLKTQTQALARTVGLQAAPALQALTDAFTELFKETTAAAGAGDALTKSEVAPWAENTARVIAFLVDAGQGVARVFEVVGKAIGASAAQAALVFAGEFSAAKNVGDEFSKDLQEIFERPLFSNKLESQLDRVKQGLRDMAAGAGDAKKKLDFKFSGPDTDKKTDFEKAIEGLERQQDALKEMSLSERTLADIQAGRYKTLTEAQQQRLVELAQEIETENFYVATRKAAADEERQANEEKAKADEEAAQGIADQRNDYIKGLRERVAALRESLMTEEELETARYETARNLLDEALAGDEEKREEYRLAREQLESEHLDRMAVLEDKYQQRTGAAAMLGAKARADFEKMTALQKTQFVMNSLAALTAGTASENRKMFEIHKAASIGNAIISTYQGIAAALEWGFPLGPIFAAIIGAAGFLQVNAIRSAQFGSTSASGASIPSASTPAIGSTPLTGSGALIKPQEAAARQQMTIVVESESGLISTTWFRDNLAPLINEAAEDGVLPNLVFRDRGGGFGR